MPNRRFLMIAGTLLLSVMGATVWLVPAVHGQTPPGPICATALDAALDAATAVQEAVPAMQGALDLLGGYRSEIGVSISDLPGADLRAGQSGAKVEEVRAGSPAAKAGLQAGDVVTSFDGERVRGARHFTRLVQETPAGRAVRLQAQRGPQTVDLTVTPDVPHTALSGRRPWPMPEPGVPDFEVDVPPNLRGVLPFERDEFGARAMVRPGRLGASVQELNPELAGYFGVKAGVLVTSVAADSAASRAGLRAGDVITAVDGAPVSDPARLRRRLWRDQDARETTLDIVRDKKAMSVTVTFDEPKGSPAPAPVKRRA